MKSFEKGWKILFSKLFKMWTISTPKLFTLHIWKTILKFFAASFIQLWNFRVFHSIPLQGTPSLRWQASLCPAVGMQRQWVGLWWSGSAPHFMSFAWICFGGSARCWTSPESCWLTLGPGPCRLKLLVAVWRSSWRWSPLLLSPLRQPPRHRIAMEWCHWLPQPLQPPLASPWGGRLAVGRQFWPPHLVCLPAASQKQCNHLVTWWGWTCCLWCHPPADLRLRSPRAF